MTVVDIKVATEKAGISHCTYEGGTLGLYHNGAAREYPKVLDTAALNKSIAEFKANTPKEWY